MKLKKKKVGMERQFLGVLKVLLANSAWLYDELKESLREENF